MSGENLSGVYHFYYHGCYRSNHGINILIPWLNVVPAENVKRQNEIYPIFHGYSAICLTT